MSKIFNFFRRLAGVKSTVHADDFETPETLVVPIQEPPATVPWLEETESGEIPFDVPSFPDSAPDPVPDPPQVP